MTRIDKDISKYINIHQRRERERGERVCVCVCVREREREIIAHAPSNNF